MNCLDSASSEEISKILKDASVPHSDDPLAHVVDESTLASSVLHRARLGDGEAFQKISKLYGGLVYHWCRSAGLSPEDSEDVGQQVFLTVARKLDGFRRDRPGDSFRGWLRVVARSRIMDHFRENADRELAVGGSSFLEQVGAVPTLDEDVENESNLETIILYERAMQLLQSEFSDQDCQAFQLVLMEGLTPKDAAATLGVSVNSIYIAKSRILKRVRDEFDDLLDYEYG
jgi:RNA polymerase sigma-70 factor, ECF subfamily